MKMFHNKGKYGLILVLVIAMVLQIAGTIVSEYVYANENVEDSEVEEQTVTDQEGATRPGEITHKDGVTVAVDSSNDTGVSVGEEDEVTVNLDDTEDESPVLNMLGSIENIVPTDVIHTVIAKNGFEGENIKDIDNYRPRVGNELWVEIEFALKANHSYGDGSTLTYKLPEPIKAASGSGPLSDGPGGVIYASYNIVDGGVVITFNENIRQHDIGIQIDKGYFGITANFESSSSDLEQSLILPDKDAAGGSITIPINFQPLGGERLNKTVSPTSGENIKELTWTVDVNTTMDNLDTEKEFKDALEGNHVYKAGSLVVSRYEVDANGAKGNKFDAKITPKFADDNKSFTLFLTGKYAYEIKYVTIPGDTEKSSQTLKNKAEFDGKTVSKSSEISYGKPLEKKGIGKSPRGTVDWEIIVNANEKDIAEGTTIIDTWSGGYKLVDGTFKVNNNDLVAGFSVSHNDTGFVLTTPATSEKFTITYTTELSDGNKVISSDLPITNEAIRSDRTDKESDRKKTISYNQQVLFKTNSNLNYQDKTVDWTIVINSAGYNMKDIILTDAFVNNNLKIKDGTFVVKRGNTALDETEYTLDYKSGAKDGFTLTIPKDGGSTDKYTITYTTDYDIKDEINPSSAVYTNKGQIKWNTNEKDYTSQEVQSTVTINNQQKNNGYKEGNYNYEEKKFYWEVGINYNFDTIANPIFTDTLSDSQIVDRESIKIYPLDLTGGGNGVINESTLLEEGKHYTLKPSRASENTFTITFMKSINNPYRIIYESKTIHDYYAPQTLNYKIINKAIFKDYNNKRGEWSKEVEVKHSNKLITKTPLQDGGSSGSGSAKVHWTLNLNWSQSTLKDPVIEDTIGKDAEHNLNQMIYKDSFKITEMNFNGTDSTPVEGTVHLPGGELYDISFSEGTTDPTFTITFKKDINKAYKVEYYTYFLGSNNTNIENTATLKYGHRSDDVTGESSNTSEEAYSANFKYFGGANASKGQIQITKVDEDNKGNLSGAVFQLWNKATDGILIEEVSTDMDGVYTFQTKLGYAKYYLVESKAPEGYSIDSSEYKTRKEITLGDTLQELTITNKKITQAVKLTKVDSADDSIKLSGANFELYKSDDTKVTEDANEDLLGELVTDENGELVVNNLPAGKYYFKEVKAPVFYDLPANPNSKTFEIEADQVEIDKVTVENTKGNKAITGTKVWIGGPTTKPNIELQLYQNGVAYGDSVKLEHGIESYTWNTLPKLDKNDKIYEYTIDEVKVPSGYSKSISDNGLTITNTYIPPVYNRDSLELIKQSENGETLAGAVFELLQNGVVIRTSKPTETDGKLVFEDLAYGTYTVREKIAPEGYVLGIETQEVEITTGGNLKTLTFTNTKTKGNIKLIKIDEKGNLLQGAEFVLQDPTSKTVGRIISNKDGVVEFKNIPLGEYTIKESKAPEGYELNNKEFKVEVKENGTTISKDISGNDLKVENTKTPENPDEEDPKDPDKPDPNDPTDPNKPVDSNDPTRPGGPNDPNRPGGPNDPARPGGPKDPNRPGYQDGNLVQTGTDINMLIPIGFIIILLGAAYIFKDKFIKE